jgi:hypothetical protein
LYTASQKAKRKDSLPKKQKEGLALQKEASAFRQN